MALPTQPFHTEGYSGIEERHIAPKAAISMPVKTGQHDKRQANKHRKTRAPRACDNCRKRKVKCTGELDQCRNCVEHGVTCVYSLARRDRLTETTKENGRLIALLKDLSLHVDDNGRQMIDDHLDVFREDGSTLASTTAPVTLGKHLREASPFAKARKDSLGPHVSSSDSLEDVADVQNENLFQSNESRATGFIGRNSSMQWMRSLKTQIKGATPPSGSAQQQSSKLRNPLRVSDSTFYLDSDDLQLDAIVDLYDLPTPEMAEKLFECYMQTVHASFPILPEVFEDQFRTYIKAAKWGRPYQAPDEWQAILNIVLAIGAHYAYLMHAEWYPEERDDLLYMIRASRILRLDKIATSLPAPSLTFIQALGLLSIYYLSIGQVSRAWMTIGISLRFALAAGLHLRNNDPSATPVQKEALIRTWWGLHSIESLVCAIIGRPCIIPNDKCTVPLPRVTPTDHSQAAAQSPTRDQTQSPPRGDAGKVTGDSLLGTRTVLTLIVQKTLAKLYTPHIPINSWDQIQLNIVSLMGELDSWAVAARLTNLCPTDSYSQSNMGRENLLLGFHYHSTKLLISRPCLCLLKRRNKGQSDLSSIFYQKTAESCVQAAQAIADLFPNQLDRSFVYEQSPWWCIVHNIMQAVAVLLLKILGATHATHNRGKLSQSVKKLLRWLRFIGVRNDVAQRAYEVALDTINTSNLDVYIDTDNLAEEVSGTGSAGSFQAFSTPSPSDISPKPPVSYPSSNQSLPQDPFATTFTTTSPQVRTPMGTQEPMQASDNFPLNYDFTPNPGPYTPSFFGNPFFTFFDESNPIFATFLDPIDVTENEYIL